MFLARVEFVFSKQLQKNKSGKTRASTTKDRISKDTNKKAAAEYKAMAYNQKVIALVQRSLKKTIVDYFEFLLIPNLIP